MLAKILARRVAPAAVLLTLLCSPLFGSHSQAPEWMHALVSVPLPAHDDKDNAVLLYEDENLTVVSADKFRRTVRRAYKILRPEGRDYGIVVVDFNSLSEKVTNLHGWCIPAAGKDFEVTDKDAAEVSPLKGDDLITDERRKVFEIPAPDAGNIIGYEYVLEERPLDLQEVWSFQDSIPVRESHFSLTLPAGWEFKDAWINYPEVKARDAGGGLWQWSVGEQKEIREEQEMPPWRGLAGRMVVSLFPPGAVAAKSFPTWHDLGVWQSQLANGRRDASPEIKQQVAALTASATTPLAKMQAVAQFVQHDVRYVAIELGIGGWQPHPAGETYQHRYGDCKDKVNLTISMLREIGVDAYDIRINVRRGSVTPEMPAHLAFNHSIAAIKLPPGLSDPSLVATYQHPTLGTLLFFDPTDDRTPLGQIRGDLQSNFGLLLEPTGGELVKLPQQPSFTSGVQRTGKLTLSVSGELNGDIREVRVGDRASGSRELYVTAEKPADKIEPVERLLADSMSTFRIGNATVTNATETNKPFIWDYSFRADNYAKFAGNLLLVRPRVLGRESRGLLETPEPRRFPIEFEGPRRDTDDFEITLPRGYVVDDVPPAVDADFGFASYHSKTEVAGNLLKYHRSFEVKELSVPVAKADQLKKFYRIIASDERNTAVLKLAGQ